MSDHRDNDSWDNSTAVQSVDPETVERCHLPDAFHDPSPLMIEEGFPEAEAMADFMPHSPRPVFLSPNRPGVGIYPDNAVAVLMGVGRSRADVFELKADLGRIESDGVGGSCPPQESGKDVGEHSESRSATLVDNAIAEPHDVITAALNGVTPPQSTRSENRPTTGGFCFAPNSLHARPTGGL